MRVGRVPFELCGSGLFLIFVPSSVLIEVLHLINVGLVYYFKKCYYTNIDLLMSKDFSLLESAQWIFYATP